MKRHKEPQNYKVYSNLNIGDAEIAMNVVHFGVSGKRVQMWEDDCSKQHHKGRRGSRL